MRQRTTAVKKAQTRETPGGLPVHSLRTLIDDLSSVIRPPGAGRERATIVTRRTRLQSRAFELPEINPDRTVPMDMTGRDHGPQPDNRGKLRRWKKPVHLRPDEVPADSGALQPVNGHDNDVVRLLGNVMRRRARCHTRGLTWPVRPAGLSNSPTPTNTLAPVAGLPLMSEGRHHDEDVARCCSRLRSLRTP